MPSTPATVAPTEARVIAREACIYGFPLVDNYRIQHSYFVDRAGPEYKAPWNALFNNARAFNEFKATQVDTGKSSSADGFGTRAYLKNDYMQRMAAAVLGIYGNSKEEAIYPVYFVDAAGQKLKGSNRYTLRFAPQQLPPVNAFWSMTLYELPASLLFANALNRYLINSAMLSGLKRDADDGITLHVQNTSPGAGAESNWLPSPNGPFFCALRLYWPKPEALDGRWKAPQIQQVS